MSRLLFALSIVAALLLGAACDDSSTPDADETAAARPVPQAVTYAAEPLANFVLGDPAFEALPGATAEFGRLGGSIYRSEVPAKWDGRLVLYLHGCCSPETLDVEDPGIRARLINRGIAWAASSFSSDTYIPGTVAGETAALWDLFTQKHGRPRRAYVTGISMGGAASYIAAERYPDRFDGALPLCASAGTIPHIGDYFGSVFVAGAFAAGVSQAQFDSTEIGALINNRVRPALNDFAARRRCEDILIALTGGPRPFVDEGIFVQEDELWDEARDAIGAGNFENRETVYDLGARAGVDSDAFNRIAVRVTGGPLRQVLGAGQEIGGDIQMLVLSLVASGDMQNPLSEEQLIGRRIEAAGKGGLLANRAIQDPHHCGILAREWMDGLDALMTWAEKGTKPEGDDIFVTDFSHLGERFTEALRFGAPGSESVPGATERVTMRGALTPGGQPLASGALTVIVRNQASSRLCTFAFVPFRGGRYEAIVAADSEARGCGKPGSQLLLYAFSGGRAYISAASADWPASGSELVFDSTLAPAPDAPNSTFFEGTAVDASGVLLPPGTVIEAYIGETLCGVTSLPHIVMANSEPQTFALSVLGPDRVPGCERDAAISFRVDGKPVEGTATHSFTDRTIDLVAKR